MNSKKIRDITFYLHRYIGLFVGLILIIVGLTGSLLVFQKEIDHSLISHQFGHIVPQGEKISVAAALDTVKAAFANTPDLKVSSITTLPGAEEPYTFWLTSSEDKRTQVFVNPYTAKILGSRVWDSTLIGLTFKLHYQLLGGEIGTYIVGVAALLLFILCVTGLVLWPGWRKLISGFKIKWQAHPKRVNFDIHKVSGIVTVVFLSLLAFTGFCWNFYDFAKPVIYAVTLSPNPAEPVFLPIAKKSPLSTRKLLQKADAALPGAVTTYVSLPQTPEGIFRVGKKLPHESNEYGESEVYLDRFSGKVAKLQNSLKASLGDRVLNSFTPLHYGTFGGLLTRILYVFVGLAPLILSVTGFVMWWYRRRSKSKQQIVAEKLPNSLP